jgi:hypothetical protein
MLLAYFYRYKRKNVEQKHGEYKQIGIFYRRQSYKRVYKRREGYAFFENQRTNKPINQNGNIKMHQYPEQPFLDKGIHIVGLFLY